MKFPFLVLFFVATINVYSQPGFQWQRTIGGNDNEFQNCIDATSDGGFLVGGFSRSNSSGLKTENSRGGHDYWIVKIDSLGIIEWDKTIGGAVGPAGMDDFLISIEQTRDGGFIAGGSSQCDSSGDKTDNTHGEFDYWIVKLDSLGSIEWQKSIGGFQDDNLSSILQTQDGGYIIGGSSISDASGDKTENCIGGYDYWIVKIDSVGNIEWQNTIGSDVQDILSNIINVNSGGYLLAGSSYSGISGDKISNTYGALDFWIVKLDQAGNILWQKDFGGNDVDECFALIQLNDGGFLVGGRSYSDVSGIKTENCRGIYDYWIIDIDSNGNIRWQKTLGGDKEDVLTSIIQDLNGDILVGGYSDSQISGDKTSNSKGYEDYWVIKLDNNGNLLWQKTIGGDGDDELRSMAVDHNNNYLIAGSSLSGISSDKYENNYGASDYWLLKSDFNIEIPEINFQNKIKIFPNPIVKGNDLNIELPNSGTLVISNIFNEIILEIPIQQSSININTDNFSVGMYFIKFSDENSRNSFTKFLMIN